MKMNSLHVYILSIWRKHSKGHWSKVWKPQQTNKTKTKKAKNHIKNNKWIVISLQNSTKEKIKNEKNARPK